MGYKHADLLNYAKTKLIMKDAPSVKKATKFSELTPTKQKIVRESYKKFISKQKKKSAPKPAKKPAPKKGPRITFDDIYGLSGGNTYINDWTEGLVEAGYTDRGAFREAKKIVNQYLKIYNKESDKTAEKALKFVKEEEKKKGN